MYLICGDPAACLSRLFASFKYITRSEILQENARKLGVSRGQFYAGVIGLSWIYAQRDSVLKYRCSYLIIYVVTLDIRKLTSEARNFTHYVL